MDVTETGTTPKPEGWQDGYDAGYTAALSDAVGLIDAMHGHGRNSLVEPLLLRIRTRFLDLMVERLRRAA